MQDTERIKTTKRRRQPRPKKAELLAISEAANQLGSAAKRLYATARIQLTKRDEIRLSELANTLEISLSDTTRRLTERAAELAEGRTRGQTISYIEARAKKANDLKRQGNERRPSKADLWARQEGGRNTRGVEIRLTYRNIADIAAEREERRIKGLKRASYSGALAALILIPLLEAEKIARRAAMRKASGLLDGEEQEEESKPRQRRNRCATEAKRRITGQDWPAKRGRPKRALETQATA